MGNATTDNHARHTSTRGDYLDSWKEIAAYLKRDITTVRRWEKIEGLPVHRHLHRKRGSVYAYKAELDTWWNNRRPKLEAQETEEAKAGKKRWKTVAMVAVAATVALAAGYVLQERFWLAAPKRVMLAVLPFENLGRDIEQDYFSDGLTEEMITQLGRLNPERLGVIARTSAMQYKGIQKPVKQIGQELGVEYVLEGSVRREGTRIRVSAQLIRVRDQSHLWAESYEQELPGIFTVQREVARRVAQSLTLKLLPAQRQALARASAVPPQAYEAYLKGRYFWNKRTLDAFENSIEYFQQAIAIDPTFALAYVGLADSYHSLAFYGALSPQESYPRAKTAALKAIELDDTLGEAHNTLAQVKLDYDRDWAGAEQEFQRALALTPSYATAHEWYGEYLAGMGRFQQAIAATKRAQELDPLSPVIYCSAAWVLYFARQYDQAKEQLHKAIELDTNFAVAYWGLGQVSDQQGKSAEAITELEQAVKLSRGSIVILGAMGHAYARGGRRAEALKVLDELRQLSKRRYVSPFSIAQIYLALGQKDQAIQSLEKAYHERSSLMWTMKVEPLFDPLRSDLRFQALLRRMNFPQ